MDDLIDNKYCSKLMNDSLTFVEKRRRHLRSQIASGAITLCVFWLPLSWLQCCDIYFSIKEFVEDWLILWDKQWFENHDQFKKNTSINSNITNIELKTVETLIQRIEDIIKIVKNKTLVAKTPKKQSCDNHIDDIVPPLPQDDQEMIAIFECMIDEMKNMFELVVQPLQKLNNFIDFFTSLYRQGIYCIHLYVLQNSIMFEINILLFVFF